MADALSALAFRRLATVPALPDAAPGGQRALHELRGTQDLACGLVQQLGMLSAPAAFHALSEHARRAHVSPDATAAKAQFLTHGHGCPPGRLLPGTGRGRRSSGAAGIPPRRDNHHGDATWT